MNPSDPNKQKMPSLSELTGACALAIGLISVWLFAVGWTYAYYYFDRFGIPLLMVDVPKENFFMYGGIVVQRFAIWGLAIFVFGVTVIALWSSVGLSVGRFHLPLSAATLLGAFWLGHQAAILAAHGQYAEQRDGDYSAFPRVQIWQRATTSSSGTSPVSADLASGCYRLLLHNQNRLFLLRPFKGAPAADLPVLISPWDQIALIRVLPDHTSCE